MNPHKKTAPGGAANEGCTLNFPTISAVLTNRNGAGFNLGLLCAFTATNQKPQTASADNQNAPDNSPKTSSPPFLGLGGYLLRLHINPVTSAFRTNQR